MKRIRLAYEEEAMVKAIEAVEKNTMSRRTAAKTFQVPRTTLRDKLSGRTPKERRLGPRPFLSMVEEQEIVEWIITAGKRGLPPHKNDIMNTVQRIFNSDIERAMRTPFVHGRPGESWWKSFLKRHPNLAIRTPERVSKARARITEPVIRNWFEKLHTYLSDINELSILNDPTRIFNTDETGVVLCPKARKVISVKGKKNVYEVAAGPEKVSLTVVGTFSAHGDVVKPAIIYPYQRIPAEIINTIPDGISYYKSKSGWMKSDAFHDFITETFNSYLIEQNVKKPVILFVDGHSSHTSMQLSIKAEELGIIIYLLHPNTTHIMQPADVGPFKPLKDHWKDLVHNYQVNNPNVSMRKQDVAPLVKEAFARIKTDTIKNAFRVCGLYPFNPDNIDYSKCLEVDIETDEGQNDMIEEISDTDYKTALKVIQRELGPIKKNLCENQVGLDVTDLYRLYAVVSFKSRIHNDDSIDDLTNQQSDDSTNQHSDNSIHQHNDDSIDDLTGQQSDYSIDQQPTSTVYLDKEKQSCDESNVEIDITNSTVTINCNEIDILEPNNSDCISLPPEFITSIDSSPNNFVTYDVIQPSQTECPEFNDKPIHVYDSVSLDNSVNKTCSDNNVVPQESNGVTITSQHEESHFVIRSTSQDSVSASASNEFQYDSNTGESHKPHPVVISSNEIQSANSINECNLPPNIVIDEANSTNLTKEYNTCNRDTLNSHSNKSMYTSITTESNIDNFVEAQSPSINVEYSRSNLTEINNNQQSNAAVSVGCSTNNNTVLSNFPTKPLLAITLEPSELKTMISNPSAESTTNLDGPSLNPSNFDTNESQSSDPEDVMIDKTPPYESQIMGNVSLPEKSNENRPLQRQNAFYIPACHDRTPNTSSVSSSTNKSYHFNTLSTNIFSNNILKFPKQNKSSGDFPSAINSKEYRKRKVQAKESRLSEKRKKGDNWFCGYCSGSWAEDIKDNKYKRWVECDTCKRQMHTKCVPKFHKNEINFDSEDSADEVDFECEFCYK